MVLRTESLCNHGSSGTANLSSTVVGSLNPRTDYIPALSFMHPALHTSYSLPLSSFYFLQAQLAVEHPPNTPRSSLSASTVSIHLWHYLLNLLRLLVYAASSSVMLRSTRHTNYQINTEQKDLTSHLVSPLSRLLVLFPEGGLPSLEHLILLSPQTFWSWSSKSCLQS